MRIRRLHISSPGAEAVNATPLIDVVMCLIVFFLIVGKLSSERGFPVNLPQTGVGQDEKSASVLIVTVSKAAEDAPRTTGSWALYGISVQADGLATDTPKSLEAMVRGKLSENPQASVQIRADRELPFGAIEPVLRAAGQGGAKSVRLATERQS